MAQPVFDEHPLGEYFRESGEIQEIMPGSHPDYEAEPSGDGTLQQSPLGPFVLHTVERAQMLIKLLFPPSPASPASAFAERFKYDVISSSLLSTSLAASPQPGRRSFVTELPGQLNAPSSGEHSRTSSTSADHSDDLFSQRHSTGANDGGNIRTVVAIVSAAVLAFAAGYELLSMLLVAIALYVARAVKPEEEASNAPALTLDALNELISAGNVWDSVINEAMSLIEKEERSPSAFYSPTSAQSPLLSLRVALHTSLTTTQSQCDNVRQLLTALTSPPQLSQLSEMYAPASPIKPSFPSLALGEPLRPLSDSVANWRKRTISLPSASNKRATWNGSQALPQGGIEGLTTAQKRERRRGVRTSLFLTPEGNLSAPPTPLPHKVLHDVKEDPSESESELPYASKDEDVFGIAALNLRRKRRSAALETFGTPPPSYTSQTHGHHSAHNSVSSISSPSRFTLLHTNRHPFSISALSLALHGALSAKRYSCAHLLALRFEEDANDDGYWEDVRSIMALLTTTFSDASGNLVLALDEVEKKRMKDARPSTESLAASSREGSLSPGDGKKRVSFGRPMRSMAEMTSFAPLPGHLTRFAAHVDAISSALNDAREHLEQCVAAIRDDDVSEADISHLPSFDVSTVAGVDDDANQNAALQAYDRLRKELGFAFRECERGRERLLDAIAASKPVVALVDEDEDVSPTMPSLAPDTSSEASVGADVTVLEKQNTSIPALVEVEQPQPPLDDATEHLLLATSIQHLPPPGAEQVYEAESAAARFTRERSKLSREERIKLAQAKRKDSLGLGSSSDASPRSSREQWGPGGEVVQELKDVIWQVSEKRRKLSERLSVDSTATADSDLPPMEEPSIVVEEEELISS